MKLPKLTKAQKRMVIQTAHKCTSDCSKDGYCEVYDITYGHKAKEDCLERLVSMGVIIKWHSKQKDRAWGLCGSSHNDDGFTLYKLAPVGIKMIYDLIKAEAEADTLEIRIARELKRFQFDEKDLKKADIVLDKAV